MKKIYVCSILFVFITSVVYGQLTVSLTFTGELNGTHHPLDSILIENDTQGGDTMLYGSDTVLILNYSIGVDEISQHKESLKLYPSYPNPFFNSTNISFYLPSESIVAVRIFDLLGREVSTLSQEFTAGTHSFIFYPGEESLYFLSIETSDQRLQQKLVNMGSSSGSNKIEYIGHNSNSQVKRTHFKGKSWFPWSPGDTLSFTGYSGNSVSMLRAKPEQSSFLVFQFYLIGCPEILEDINGN